jgi:hypothetical protein
LPISQIAFTQLQRVNALIESVELTENPDKWIQRGGSEQYSAKMAYRALCGHSDIHSAFKWLWKCRVQPKHKVIFWLMIKDRLSTMNMLRRKHMELESYYCALCNELIEETSHHLFVDCAFARMCWDIIGIQITADSHFPELTAMMRTQLNSCFFMESIILLCWTIWTAKNDLVFRGQGRNKDNCSRVFFKELGLLKHRLKQGQENQFQAWIQNLESLAA